ncbi:MAG: outer membrane lipid asymmetry maintenance protein MlaD [Proteobacteria bacterium]|nr:outer membrane lipid asymmetry maintenance protein MlaD [Pseudomonadota bacterium]
MKDNIFEVIVGTIVLLCAAYFFIFSFQKSDVSTSNTYQVIADFDNVEGINPGSDVKISGVKIGTVDAQILNPITYRARLRLNIDDNIKLPADSSAKISSSGLLGGKHLAIEPGADEEIMKSGDKIEYTQSSVSFEDLLGKFIFNSSTNAN